MSDDGPKYGGSVNRPASRQEITKVPRRQCTRCLITGPRDMFGVDGHCRKETACRIRCKRLKGAKNG